MTALQIIMLVIVVLPSFVLTASALVAWRISVVTERRRRRRARLRWRLWELERWYERTYNEPPLVSHDEYAKYWKRA